MKEGFSFYIRKGGRELGEGEYDEGRVHLLMKGGRN